MPNPPANTPLITQPSGNNPVSQPSVTPQAAAAPSSVVAEPRNAQGLTVAEMSRQAEAMSSRATQTAPAAPTGTTQTSGTISSTRTTPLPTQGLEAPGSRQETYVTPSNAAEVARLNNISLSEAEARINRATAAQDQGRLIQPAGVRVSYDPATDTYQDRLTKNYYAGFDPNLGHIFTPDATRAIKGMFTDVAEGGVITPDKTTNGVRMLGDGITRAEDVSMALPFSDQRTAAEDPANASKVGSMWESTLPPEYQELVKFLGAERERLASGEDEASLLLRDLRDRMQAREEREVASIQEKATIAREDQEEANRQALARAKVFFASIGGLGGSQAMQYMADTIAGGERALRDLANAERDAISKARDAYADKEFELAFKQVELAEQRRAEYKQTLTDTIAVKNQFEQMAMQKLQFQKQMTQMDLQEREMKQQSAANTMKMMLEAGAGPDDIPQSTYDAWSMDLGVSSAAAKQIFLSAEKTKKATDASALAAAMKDVYESAQYIPEGQSINFPMPNGESLTIQGTFIPGSDGYKSQQVTLGSNQFGPAGQYMLTSDANGNTVNAVYLGEHFTSPVYDPDRGVWKTYNPINNTETTVMENGQYGEGTAGVSIASNYVSGLGLKVTQEPGGGFSHNNLTGWDVAMNAGTSVKIPDISGRVIGIHPFDQTLSENPGDNTAYGTYVDVQDINSGAVFRFGHLSSVADGLTVGSSIGAGTEIGKSGNTGWSTGPHLHFEVRTADNRAVTPNRNAPGSQQQYIPEAAVEIAPNIVSEFQQETGLTYDSTSKRSQEAFAGWRKEKRDVARDMAKDNRTFAQNVKKDFDSDPSVKSFTTIIEPKYQGMVSALNRMEKNLLEGKSISVQDQAIITSFNKLLDEGSVVREAEFARTAAGQSWLDQIQGRFQQAGSGGSGVTPEVLRETVAQASEFYNIYQNQFNNKMKNEFENAKLQQYDPRVVIGIANTPPVVAQGTDGQYYEVDARDPDFLDAFLTGIIDV